MSLQFADFNADGHQDIVTATWEGSPFVVLGGEKGWSQPEYIKDKQGRRIILGFYYDMEENDYKYADRSPEGRKNPKSDHLISALAYDWDADGDLDLLLGAKTGRLYLQKNEGKAGAPSFEGVNHVLKAGDGEFSVPGGMTSARPVDWNGDGLTDLVCGSFEGGVYLYTNTGKKGAPAFAAPETLISKQENKPDGPRLPTSGWYVDPVDYDGDGDLDLLVGGYANWTPPARKLNDAETKRVTEIDKELETLSKQMNAIYRKIDAKIAGLSKKEARETRSRLFKEMKIFDLSKRLQALHKEKRVLVPGPQREAGLWLFRRNDT